MELPENLEVNETKTGWFWFDEDGILCSTSKENPPELTPEESKAEMEQFLKTFGKEKCCMLIDAKHTKPNTAKERKQAAEVLYPLTKAMAVIVHNAMGRMVVNLYVGLQKPPFPMKIFKPGEEEKARTWLHKYL